MTRTWFLRPATLACAWAALLPFPAIADIQILDDDTGMRLIGARDAAVSRPARRTAFSSSDPETIWVGYWSGANTADNWWKVGGLPQGSAYRHPYNTEGMWTFEPDQQVHGDSLSGWWSIRLNHANSGGATLTDENRPWWAVPWGNIANHAGNPGDGSTRTFGVVGVWHRDAGNTATQVLQNGLGGVPPANPSWAPLEGGHSAWMGLRAHGDLTIQDPITGNHYNGDVVQYLGRGVGSVAPGHARKRLPGYLGDMDQMLYRDIDMTGYAGGGLALRFVFRTNMSTGSDTNPRTRTGWHEGDGLSQNQYTVGNFISAEAGVPENSEAPVDSFQVYMGAPVEEEWITSLHPYDQADNPALLALGVFNLATGRRFAQDPARRWFNEVLHRDARRHVFAAHGDNDPTLVTVSLSDAQVSALLDSANADGITATNDKLRLVFRVHTNRVFDDGTASVPDSYNSGYAGAAVVDAIEIDLGNTGSFSMMGDFEAATSIDNDPAVSAADAWKSTGKPPATYFHPHDMTTLPYQDACGPVNSPDRQCNLDGVVVSFGLHDQNEAATDPGFLSTERNGLWGMISPTINLAGADQTSSDPTRNNMNLTASERFATRDILLASDSYEAALTYYIQGQFLLVGFQSYPAQQADGVETWGEIVTMPFANHNGTPQNCRNREWAGFANGAIRTSNVNGYPDSLRVFVGKYSQCYRFGVSLGCSSTDGNYTDNLAVALIDGEPNVLSIDIWDLYNDAFPANEAQGLPGTAAFDTAAAHVKTGVNIAPYTGDITRYNVPGDSLVARVEFGRLVGDSIRLDLVFRVMPGVGNYVTVGDRTSGLRGAPTSDDPHGPEHFWASYKSNPGTFSGPPGQANLGAAIAMHQAAPSGWSELVWNSARMDTADQHALFPVQSLQWVVGGRLFTPGAIPDKESWSATYHEDELVARPSLGILRNRCFLIDTLVASIANANLNCGAKVPYPPAWVTALPASRTGWDGGTTTREGTKILPDGLLTPGAHVQYFVRRQNIVSPWSAFEMVPDTSLVSPQLGEVSADGHRWQQFGVLPDRWKASEFGGQGMACMLVYDNSDRRGDERVWKGIADSIGATCGGDIGAADGYGGVPGTGDVNDPAYFIANKNRNMGTLWDIYQMKASESLWTGAQSIGSRLGYRAVGSLMDDGAGNGKWTYNPPTPEMLDTYYKFMLVLTGNVEYVWGPYGDRSGDDIAMFEDWLLGGNATSADRGFMVVGSDFTESAFALGGQHQDFVASFLATELVGGNYNGVTLDPRRIVDLSASAPIGDGGLYGASTSCNVYHDVLSPNAAVPGAAADLEYVDPMMNRWTAGVYRPHSASEPWVSQTIGVEIEALRGHYGTSTGRAVLLYHTLINVFGSICALTGCPVVGLDTPQAADGRLFNYAGLWNNPLVSGHVAVRLGLAGNDFVRIAVYDLAGRRVRVLAERLFKAGEHSILWDGRDDQGRPLPRGVYFTQVRYRDSGFESARKITILK